MGIEGCDEESEWGRGAKEAAMGRGAATAVGWGADHGKEGDVSANLDAAHVDLDDCTLAVGVVQRHALVRSGRHKGTLYAPLPGWVAVRHPELVGQQHRT